VYVTPIPSPPRGLKNAKCPKFEQSSAITSKPYDIEYQLVLISKEVAYVLSIGIDIGDLE